MNIIDSKVLKNSGLVSKTQFDPNKQNFEKKIEISIRRTLILEDKSRRAIWIQKQQKLKIKYLILLS